MKSEDKQKINNSRQELRSISRELKEFGIENLDIQKLDEYKQIILNYEADVLLDREAKRINNILARQIKFKILNKESKDNGEKIKKSPDGIFERSKNKLNSKNNTDLPAVRMRQDPEILRSMIVDDINFIISKKGIKG